MSKKAFEKAKLDIIKLLIEIGSLLAVLITFLFQVINQSTITISYFAGLYAIFIFFSIIFYSSNLIQPNKGYSRFLNILEALVVLGIISSFSLLFSFLLQIAIGDVILSTFYMLILTSFLFLILTGKIPFKKKSTK